MEKRRWTNEEVAEYRKTHEGFGYSNREDSRIIVPKAFGIGFTFNWANPLSWVILVSLIAVVLCLRFVFGVGSN